MEFVSCVWCSHEEQKLNFLTELSAFCSKNQEPILNGGDFNIIRYSLEKNKSGGVQIFSDMFNTLFNFHELREIVMSGGIYTWSNNQDDPVLEKLERILVSRDWESIFPNSLVKRLPREISYHSPLILSSGPCKTIKHLEFKFELSWFSNPDFLPFVEKIWKKHCNASSTLDRIQ